MAFVPGYDWDLFVSYAHKDNEVVFGKPWVSDLVGELKRIVPGRIGLRDNEELKVFRDGSAVTANFELPQLLAGVKRSALFLAIGSPSYVGRRWTLDEVKTFRETARDSSRLFSIECLPVMAYPDELALKIRQKFWERTEEREIAVTLTLELYPRQYRENVLALAEDIAQKLKAMKAAAESQRTEAARPVPAGVVGNGFAGAGRRLKKVLLAKPVGALEDALDGLRATLEQYDDEVMVVSAGDYPLGGPEFSAAFAGELETTDLFVQLLGRRPAQTPPDFPEGYTRFQARLAAERGVPVLQWRPADLDLSAVTDAEYRAMLEADTVEVSGMEALKARILKFARATPPPPPPPPGPAILFIAADPIDREVAVRVRQEFPEREIRFAAELVEDGGSMSSSARRKDLQRNLEDSDILVFLYRESTVDWLRAKLFSLSKSRGLIRREEKRTKRLEVVYIGPPANKPDPGVYLPSVRMLPCPADGNLEPLLQLIRQAGA